MLWWWWCSSATDARRARRRASTRSRKRRERMTYEEPRGSADRRRTIEGWTNRQKPALPAAPPSPLFLLTTKHRRVLWCQTSGRRIAAYRVSPRPHHKHQLQHQHTRLCSKQQHPPQPNEHTHKPTLQSKEPSGTRRRPSEAEAGNLDFVSLSSVHSGSFWRSVCLRY